MEKLGLWFKKGVYAVLFCGALPLLLWFWSKETAGIISLPVPDFPYVGLLVVLFGIGLIFSAIWGLWFKGKGLPMNAYPPKFYVKTGAYRLFRHPIYIGAILVCVGLSFYFRSASGLWLVSPLFGMLITMYVLGFEREVMEQHFSESIQTHQPLFSLPANTTQMLSSSQKWGILLVVFGGWLLIYECFIYFGIPKDAFFSEIVLDSHIPLIESSVIFYNLLYPMVIILPFILKTHQQGRSFVLDSLVGMAIIFYCYLTIPAVLNYQAVSSDNFFAKWIMWGRAVDGETGALPSFHVFWALICYHYYKLQFSAWKLPLAVLAFLIIVSCLTTKNHTLLDVVTGVFAYLLTIYRQPIYLSLLKGCERISNSWREWHFGRVRIINHGFYAAIGGFCGFMIMGYFLPDRLWILYAIGIAGFVGAGLWAQLVEGSHLLLRPFGYYGSVIGVAVVIGIIALFSDIQVWYLTAIAALAASPIQFWGRFRCLVQGCCHGKPTQIAGICFHHPKSRVNKLAGWKGVNLYPTQFYSIAANFFTFFILWRFVTLEMPLSFITGMYLILNGAFRFVEESLRGEPQTPYFLGMRVYQWLALLSIVTGIFCTMLPSGILAYGSLNLTLWLNGIVYFCIILFAYGIDFPKSNVRFSRLTQE